MRSRADDKTCLGGAEPEQAQVPYDDNAECHSMLGEVPDSTALFGSVAVAH